MEVEMSDGAIPHWQSSDTLPATGEGSLVWGVEDPPEGHNVDVICICEPQYRVELYIYIRIYIRFLNYTCMFTLMYEIAINCNNNHIRTIISIIVYTRNGNYT